MQILKILFVKVNSKTMTPDYKNASLLYNTNEKITENYTAKSNGFIIGSGYGNGQSTSYIYATINGVRSGNQGATDEVVGIAMPIQKGDNIKLEVCLSQQNYGIYFVPAI